MYVYHYMQIILCTCSPNGIVGLVLLPLSVCGMALVETLLVNLADHGLADYDGGVSGARLSAVGGSGTAPVWQGLVRNAAPQSRLSAQ